jgi:hypothetical protein
MADPQDLTAAKSTYDSFIGTLKWSVPALAAIAALVVVVIS